MLDNITPKSLAVDVSQRLGKIYSNHPLETIKEMQELIELAFVNQPQFIIKNALNLLKELCGVFKDSIDDKKHLSIDMKYLREDLYDHVEPLFSRLLKSIVKDIDYKKGWYMGNLWKNINLRDNFYIDINTALECFDLMDKISFRGLCIIKMIVEKVHRDNYESLDIKCQQDFNVRDSMHDKHKIFNTHREVKNLINLGVIVRLTEDINYLEDFLLKDVTYLGTILYNLMELETIPESDMIVMFEPWRV